ncbi:hypothetical protein SNEBB_007217 [Seison nebaliae]|nr:hypothetical protein SNEBB_007217 [Seison nebaliae]
MLIVKVLCLILAISLVKCPHPSQITDPTNEVFTNPMVYKQLSYRNKQEATNNVFIALPSVTSIPKVQKQVRVSEAKFEQIQLNEDNLKDAIIVQQAFKNYFETCNGNEIDLFIIAFKRTIHLAFSTFSMKILIHLLTLERTIPHLKEQEIHPDYLNHMAKIKKSFTHLIDKYYGECRDILHENFSPQSFVNFETVSVAEIMSARKFMSMEPKDPGKVFACSRVIVSLVELFTVVMQNVFLPISELIHSSRGVAPLKVLKFVNVKRLQANHTIYAFENYGNIIERIVSEYNFFQSIDTRGNYGLYYRLMLDLAALQMGEKMVTDLFLERIEEAIIINLGVRSDRIAGKMRKLKTQLQQYQQLENAPKLSKFVKNVAILKNFDESDVVYDETFGTEETAIFDAFDMIMDYAFRYAAAKIIENSREFLVRRGSRDIILKMVYKLDWLDKVVIKGFKPALVSTVLVDYTRVPREVRVSVLDVPLTYAQLLSERNARSTTIEPVNKFRSRSRTRKNWNLRYQNRRELYRNRPQLLAHTARSLSPAVKEGLRFHDDVGITRKRKHSLRELNPPTYWPIIPKENELIVKPGESWNLIDFDDLRYQLEQQDKEDQIKQEAEPYVSPMEQQMESNPYNLLAFFWIFYAYMREIMFSRRA